MKIKSYISIFMVCLLLGCSAYPSVRKEEPPAPSKEMGKAFVREALQHYQFVKDPEVVKLVNSVGRRIVKTIGANPDSYHFFVVRGNQPNAFAIPGGYIFIFDGLLLQLRDEEELAGVLAHEIAHVERNHFFKDAKKVAALDIATIAAILLGGGGIAATTIASAANIDVRLQFSRENESEADSYGLRYLQTAGYPPRSLLNFFDNLIRYERFNPQSAPAYMSTHPDLASRRDIVANFVLREAREEVTDYLLGLTYMKEGRFNEAISKYLSAIEQNRENPVYYADLAFCYLKQQDLSRARESALQSLQLKADHAPAHVILGMLDQDSGNLSEAIGHLEEALRIEPEDLTANFHLAMAYRKSGDAVREAFYSARYLRINLNPEGALGELNRARGLAAEDSPLYFRISEEIQEIKREGL